MYLLDYFILIICVKLVLYFKFAVIDDEASTVFTAGAIVTVTVVLKRRNLSEVFGDETYKDKNIVENNEKEQKEKEQKEKEKENEQKEKEKENDQNENQVQEKEKSESEQKVIVFNI